MIYYTGIKCLQPPPLPSNHVNRQILLDEMVTKLSLATINPTHPSRYETTLTITGAGGFGKTTAVISLCHCPTVKEHFTDGIVFIELGPQATDPNIKLCHLYQLLDGEHLKQCNVNEAEQKIKDLTSTYYRYLLVIIDDVWHFEDAIPLVNAFSNCATILTTRRNDIEQYIPFHQSVIVGPMTNSESISLLTSGIVDNGELSQEDVNLLDELAQDVHLWPLLLSLIRGQLHHFFKLHHLSYHTAIQNVQDKIHHKGLVACDKNVTDAERVDKSRKFAVKVCIEITLELLPKSSSDKMKSLILYTGIGNSLQTVVLNDLWNISKQEVCKTVNRLWAYGLIQFSDIAIASDNNNTQHCVKVHAVISDYIMEHMNSNEVWVLSVAGKQDILKSISKKSTLTFQQSYGVDDLSSLTVTESLKYKLHEINYGMLPQSLKSFSAYLVIDPHAIISTLEMMKYVLITSPHTKNLWLLLSEDINLLLIECKKIIMNAYNVCRKFNQTIERSLYEEKYEILVQVVEDFIKNYPVYDVAQKAITMVNKTIQYCEGKLLHYMMSVCEEFKVTTHDYHDIATFTLPHVKFYVGVIKRIRSSLQNGSPYIELIYDYFVTGKFEKELRLLTTSQLTLLQEVAPIGAHKLK